MKILSLAFACIVIALVNISVDGVVYNYLSISCRDINKDVFETEKCTVNGQAATIILTLKKNLSIINVRAWFKTRLCVSN